MAGAALQPGRLSSWLRVIVAELDAELGSVLAARAAPPRGWPRLLIQAGVGWVPPEHLPARTTTGACLDGTVAAFLAGFAERGGTDLDSVNALGVADYAVLSPAQVLARWRAASADNRRRFRERADEVSCG